MTATLTSDLGPHLAGVNANIDCGTVDLLPSYPLNVDHPLLSVNGNHLAFSALHLPTHIHELEATKRCMEASSCCCALFCQCMKKPSKLQIRDLDPNISCLLPPLV